METDATESSAVENDAMEHRRQEMDRVMAARHADVSKTAKRSEPSHADAALIRLEQLYNDVKADLEALENREVDENEVKELQSKLKMFESKLSEDAYVIAGYDLKRMHNAMFELMEKMESFNERKKPRKKFGFKNKKAAIATTTTIAKSTGDIESASAGDSRSVSSASLVLSGRQNERNVVLEADEVDNQDVLLADLSGCTVILKGAPSAVFARDLSECTISISGRVTTSFFIDRCDNCAFFLSCHQLRIHRATNSQFYIDVVSKAIIEDSLKIGFASVSGDDDESVRKKVDDFNWLSNDQPSPNWRILPKEERRNNPNK